MVEHHKQFKLIILILGSISLDLCLGKVSTNTDSALRQMADGLNHPPFGGELGEANSAQHA